MATLPSCTLPVRFSWLSSLYTARCCRSSRSQLTAKGARRVDGQNSSAVTSKKIGFPGKVCMFAFSIDASKFSYFEALVYVSVLCSRFLSRIRKAISPTGPITDTDLRVAKTKWLRYVQQNDCGMVMTALSQKSLISWPQTKSLLR